MADVLQRIPNNVRAVFWIKPNATNTLDTENIKKINEQLITYLSVTSLSNSVYELGNQKLSLVNISPETNFSIHTFPESQLVCVEVFSLSNLSKTEIDKAVSAVFSESSWIRSQYY